jgi:DNA polymerase III alpha subunit (gram-positive type)
MATLIYDFETSGLNTCHDDIIEIGCRCLETSEYFTCLVQPLSDKLLSEKIESITGITNKLLKKEGKTPKESFKLFFDLLKHYHDTYESITMIAHNGRSFDDIFLRRIHRYLQGEEHFEYDIVINNIKYIDTLAVSRLLHPERLSHSMKSMCMIYNIINENEHRAMGDVDALAKLWSELLKKLTLKYTDTSPTYINYLTYHE